MKASYRQLIVYFPCVAPWAFSNYCTSMEPGAHMSRASSPSHRGLLGSHHTHVSKFLLKRETVLLRNRQWKQGRGSTPNQLELHETWLIFKMLTWTLHSVLLSGTMVQAYVGRLWWSSDKQEGFAKFRWLEFSPILNQQTGHTSDKCSLPCPVNTLSEDQQDVHWTYVRQQDYRENYIHADFFRECKIKVFFPHL